MAPESELHQFLHGHSIRCEEEIEWPQSTLRLRSYLTEQFPPDVYVTSVRCVVLGDDSVLVVQDPVSVHILPGGRREEDESLEQTARREVLEETGWVVGSLSPVGFGHFHHLTPKPPGYRYPYPDFLQVIYVAKAVEFRPEAKEVDGYEIGATFHLLHEVKTLGLPDTQLLFLNAAVAELAVEISGKV